MKKFLFFLLAAITAASAFATTPTPPGGAPTPVGDVAFIGYQPSTNSWIYPTFDSSGNLNVTGGGGGGGGGTSSNFAATFPTAGTAAGFKDSTGLLMTFAKVNANNAQLVDGSAVTQPVSIAGSVAVTGTFYQATQPVSGTFWQTTQPVSLTTLPALVAGTANIGHVDGQGTAGTPTGGVLTIQGVASGTVVPTQESRLPTSLGQLAAANSLGVALANEDVQDMYFTGQSAQTATVNNIIPATSGTAATDATGFQSGSIQVTSTGTGGTFIFEGSNDNVNFQTIPVYNQAIITGVPITSAVGALASQLIYTFPIQVRYIRLRIASTITGGSIQAFTTLKRSNFNNSVTAVANSTTANLLMNANVVSLNGTAMVTGGVAGIQAVGGNVAQGSAATANPLPIGGVTLSTVPAAAIANALTQRMTFTGDQQLIVHQDGDPANEFQATSGVTPLATNSSTQLVAAAGSGIRHYVTGIQVYNTSATVSTNISILDGSTVIWTGYVPAMTTALVLVPNQVEFRTPLKGTAATALNIQCGTTGASVYYNVQGFNNN